MSALKSRSGQETLTDTNIAATVTTAKHREVLKSLDRSVPFWGDAEVRVVNMSTTDPSGLSPSDLDKYVVAASATGDWSGQDDNIAIWDASSSPGSWFFITPTDGMAVWNLDDDSVYRWDAGASPAAWVVKSPGTDDAAIHDNVAGEIAAVTEKASPVNADLVLIEDSEASNAKKRVQVGNLPGGGSGLTRTRVANVDLGSAASDEVVVNGLSGLTEHTYFEVHVLGVTRSASEGILFRVSDDDGSTYKTGASDYRRGVLSGSEGAVNDSLVFLLTAATSAGDGLFRLHHLANANAPTMIEGTELNQSEGNIRIRMGLRNASGAEDAFKLYVPSGQMDGGRVVVYQCEP